MRASSLPSSCAKSRRRAATKSCAERPRQPSGCHADPAGCRTPARCQNAKPELGNPNQLTEQYPPTDIFGKTNLRKAEIRKSSPVCDTRQSVGTSWRAPRPASVSILVSGFIKAWFSQPFTHCKTFPRHPRNQEWLPQQRGSSMKCVWCGSKNVRISKLQAADFLRLLFCRYPVRCRVCLDRGHVNFIKAWRLHNDLRWQPQGSVWFESPGLEMRVAERHFLRHEIRSSLIESQRQSSASHEAAMVPDSAIYTRAG
jgi:hypothetical protein